MTSPHRGFAAARVSRRHRLIGVTVAVAVAFGGLSLVPQRTADAAPAPSASRQAPDPVARTGGCNERPPQKAGTTRRYIFRSGGRARAYYLRLPDNYRRKKPKRMLFVLHGRTTAKDPSGRARKMWHKDAITVFPWASRGKTSGENRLRAWQGAPYSHKDVNDVKFMKEMVRRIKGSICVRQNKVYVVGNSNGGGFTAILACKMARTFAAVVINAGAFYRGYSNCPKRQTRPMPILHFHSKNDPVVPYDGGRKYGTTLPKVRQWVRKWSRRNHTRKHVVRKTWGEYHVVLRRAKKKGRSAGIKHIQLTKKQHQWPSGNLVGNTSMDEYAWRYLRRRHR